MLPRSLSRMLASAVCSLSLTPIFVSSQETVAPGLVRAGTQATDGHGDPLHIRVLARMGTTRLRHEHSVLALAYSPDGRVLLTGGNDFTARLWDLGSGKELHRLSFQAASGIADSPARSVHGVAFSSNGKLCAAGNGAGAAILWDAATGKQLFRLTGHQGAVRGVCFLPDNKTVITGSLDQTIRFWDVATGKTTKTIAAQEPVSSLLVDSKGDNVFAGTSYGSIRVFETGKGNEVRNIDAHRGAIHTMALTADGGSLASAGYDKIIRIWNVSKAGNPNFSPYVLAGIPWGRRPGFIPIVQGVELLRLSRDVRELPGHDGEIHGLVILADGKTLVSASLDRSLRFWELATGKQQRQFDRALGPLMCMGLSRDGKSLATGGEHCIVRLWNPQTGQESRLDDAHQGPIEFVGYSLDGLSLTTSSKDLTIRVWNAATGAEKRRFANRSNKGTAVAHSRDGKLAASGLSDGKIQLWDPLTGSDIRQLSGHQGAVLSLAFSSDGKTLASGGEDLLVRLWNPHTGQGVGQLKGPERGVEILRFSPNDRLLAGGCLDESIYLWEPATSRLLHHLAEHGADVDCFAFSPDGQHLAAGSKDGVARLWNAVTGKISGQLTGHSGSVTSLVYSMDGKTIAAGCWRSIRLWEVASGRVRGRLDGQQGEVRSLAIAPSGQTLAAGTSGTCVETWDITGCLKNGNLEAESLTPARLDGLWGDLQSEDAARAYRAIWTMFTGSREAVPYLQRILKPARPLTAEEQKRVQELVAALDNDNFETREKAALELERLGDLIEPHLSKMLGSNIGPQVCLEVEQLLKKLREPARLRERVRLLRANEVLEKIASPEAIELLRRLAQGAEHAAITLDAKGALERLERRGAIARE